MMSMFLFLSSFAQPTYNLPHASNTPSGVNLSLGTGVAALRAGPLPAIRGTASWNYQNTMIRASTTVYVGQSTERFDVLSVRQLIINNDSFRLAPTLMLAHHEGVTSFDQRSTSRIGLAMDAGKGAWKWDISLNILGAELRPNSGLAQLSVFDTVLAFESGIRYQIKDNHFFRMGFLGPMPTLQYTIPFDHFRLAITGSTLGDQHLLHADVVYQLP